MSHDRSYQLCLLRPDVELMGRYGDEFLRSKEAAGRAQSTIALYRRALVEFSRCVPAWPPMASDLEEYLLQRRQKVSEISVLSNWRAVHVFLNWCEQRGYLSDNPLRYVDKPRARKSLPKPIPKERLRRLFRAMAQEAERGNPVAMRDYAMFRLCHATGCRCSELAALTLDDVDMQQNAIFIVDGKGGKDRVSYFAHQVREVIQAWLEVHPGGKWLFPSRVRWELRPLTRRGVYSALQRYCKRVGVRATVHQFRHTCASDSIDNEIGLEDVKNQLGHRSIATTLLYVKRNDPRRRRAYVEKGPGRDM